jgi:hypothetical protein
MFIAVDFDGTCVTHDYPAVGKEIGAVPVLRALVERGHQLILWTMRCDEGLADAVEWFRSNGVQLYHAQRNPTQDKWTSSPKCYAHIYIDDAALGCPLRFEPSYSDRPFVDWTEVEAQLVAKGVL